jgi:hypothetical protein
MSIKQTEGVVVRTLHFKSFQDQMLHAQQAVRLKKTYKEYINFATKEGKNLHNQHCRI